MTNKNTKNGENSTISSIATKFSNWYNIIILVVLIGTGIGNYMLSNYRHEQHDKDIAELKLRVKATEEVNYELLITQLTDIQDMNNKLADKINETNGRIDKVLEILIDK